MFCPFRGFANSSAIVYIIRVTLEFLSSERPIHCPDTYIKGHVASFSFACVCAKASPREIEGAVYTERNWTLPV